MIIICEFKDNSSFLYCKYTDMLKFALTHCILVDSSSVIYWTSPFVILGVSGLFSCLYSVFVGKSCKQKCLEPDQMQHYVASDLGLHCLSRTLFLISM